MAFYNPMSIEVADLSVIVYLDQGIEKILGRSKRAVIDHITQIQKRLDNQETDYQINILWEDDDDPMTDAWIFSQTYKWGSGPLSDVKIFRGLNEVNNIGVGSENTLIMLGREGEYRRQFTDPENLKDYLTGPRPELPSYLSLNEDFDADGNRN
jgi:hypothetical protein